MTTLAVMIVLSICSGHQTAAVVSCLFHAGHSCFKNDFVAKVTQLIEALEGAISR